MKAISRLNHPVLASSVTIHQLLHRHLCSYLSDFFVVNRQGTLYGSALYDSGEQRKLEDGRSGPKGDCDIYRELEVIKHSCEALEGPRVNASADVLLSMVLSQPLLAMTRIY